MVGFMQGLGCGCCGEWCDGVQQGTFSETFSPPYFQSPDWGWQNWYRTDLHYQTTGRMTLHSGWVQTSTGNYWYPTISAVGDNFRRGVNFNLYDYEISFNVVYPLECNPIGRYNGTTTLWPITTGYVGGSVNITAGSAWPFNSGTLVFAHEFDGANYQLKASWTPHQTFSGVLSLAAVDTFSGGLRAEWLNRGTFPAQIRLTALFNGTAIDTKTMTVNSFDPIICNGLCVINSTQRTYIDVYAANYTGRKYFDSFDWLES